MTWRRAFLQSLTVCVLLVIVLACQSLAPVPSPILSAVTATDVSSSPTAVSSPSPTAVQKNGSISASVLTISPDATRVTTTPGSSVATATSLANGPAGGTTSPTPDASDLLALPNPPPRNLIDLQRRLKPLVAGSATVAPRATANLAVGSELGFWIANQTSKNYFHITAKIVTKTDHAYWLVQDGADAPTAELQIAATYFETNTYPIEHQLFGSEWTPGIDHDVHIAILIAHVPGVGGYFSTADEYPTEVNPYSNEREMIYINVDGLRPGSSGFNGTVAHEFMHMIQFNVHLDQDSWVNEGSAELASQAVTGAASSAIRAFERRPDTQLSSWSPQPADAVPHYGAAYLWMRYVSEHFGGFAAVGRATAEPGRGIAAFDEFFQTLHPSRSFDDVFADWIAANALNDTSFDEGRLGYHSLAFHPTVLTGPARSKSVNGVASQFGATYFSVAPLQDGRLSFAGRTTTRLIGGDPKDAPTEWWSNHGDSIDSRLTRALDLRGVKTASVHFWAWYDIEEGYDYAFIESSVDGGKTWATLSTHDTTDTNPNGANYGSGFTGTSGGKTPIWVSESGDLTPYAGRNILLRFEYVTDDSYNGDGFAIDGVEVPEIGFKDDPVDSRGWNAEGFAKTRNIIPQTYLVEVLSPTTSPHVRRMTIGSDGRGSLDLTGGQPVVVAVSGTTRDTTHGAPFTLELGVR